MITAVDVVTDLETPVCVDDSYFRRHVIEHILHQAAQRIALCPGGLLCRNIDDNRNEMKQLVVFSEYRRNGDAGPNRRAVLADITFLAGIRPDGAATQKTDVLLGFGQFIRRRNVPHIHAYKLFGGIAEHFAELLVDPKKPWIVGIAGTQGDANRRAVECRDKQGLASRQMLGSELQLLI